MRVGEERNVGSLIKTAFNTARYGRAKRIGEVEYHHSHAVVAAAAQGARQLVRTVSQAAGRLGDAVLGLSSDVTSQRRVVQHDGNRAGRKPAVAGDIADGNRVMFLLPW